MSRQVLSAKMLIIRTIINAVIEFKIQSEEDNRKLYLQDFLRPFVLYHRFISFSLYIAGFVAFVFSLVKKHYLKQFTLVSSH